MSKNFIKLIAIKKVVKNGKSTFDSFKTKMNLIVKGEEEKGFQEKWVDLKFRQVVKNKPVKTSLLICKDSKVDAPTIYQIFIDKETGKKIYPVVWVKEIEEVKEIKRKVTQSSFVYNDEDDEEVEVEDGE